MRFIIIITFYSTLLLRPILIVSSSNFIIMWIRLEIRTFSFLPLIYSRRQSAFSTIKYFFIQSIASVIILASFFSYIPSFSTRLLFIALILKLGLAPFHFWLPKLVYSLRPAEILLLLIWQKIGPLYLTTFLPLFNQPIKIILGLIRVGVGRFLGLKQTQWKQIFTFSSISHLGWLFIRITFSIWRFLIYFLVYSIAFIQVIISRPRKFINSSIFSFSGSRLISLLIILSLAGLPPILGFITKLIVLFYLITSPLIALISILLLAFSMVRIYFYLKIFFSLTLLYSNGELIRNKIFVVRNIILFISMPLLLNF
jgi:NADH:ubiquinone oxidoreductase subunit 2 (subunit N)